MEKDRIAKSLCKSVMVVVQRVSHGRGGLIPLKECLKKRGLDVRQARRMVQDRIEWRGFVRVNAW